VSIASTLRHPAAHCGGRAVRRLAVAAALALGLALPATAGASDGIGSHGPVTEAYGWFPEWYEDSAGTRLELCLEGPYCMASIEAPLPHPDQPASFPDNFPDEAFWWAAETTLTYPGGQALLVLGQEAAFANGPLVAGEQVAFARIRIRATGLVPGAWYRFTHPYGQIDLQAVDKAPRVVNYTSDVGCIAAPCDDDAFARMGDGVVGPDYLQWDTTRSAPPEGYLGNPSIAHRVTGSRFVPDDEGEPANYFRIQRIDGPGGKVTGEVGQTDFFNLQGKLAGPAQGHFAAAPLRFDARTVGTSAVDEVTLRNTGSGELALGNAAVGGDDAPDFWVAGGDCALPRTLAPGETCRLRVGFEPSAVGERTARLEVGGTAGGEPTLHTVALSGGATAVPVPVTPTPAATTPAATPGPGPAALVPLGGTVTVLGATAHSTRATVRALTVAPRITRARVRAEGLRVALRIAGEANVVRVRIRRARDGWAGPLVTETFRSPTSNPVRLRLAARALRRGLTPGRYRVEIAAGTSRTTLGPVATRTVQVTR
jgi:hypothetical protein